MTDPKQRSTKARNQRSAKRHRHGSEKTRQHRLTAKTRHGNITPANKIPGRYRRPHTYRDATGTIEYNMTNDWLFHYVLQTNRFALKGLIASLLHLSPGSIRKIRIENPIMIGQAISSKEMILDILVSFNDNTYLNLEMQVINGKNWDSRSLSYLCRRFDDLDHGEDYGSAKPVYQIGLLDFTLFRDHPEFYGTYRMCNLKDGYVYSDKLTISVVELNHIDLATDEDRQYGIDKWARLFKASTWEELKMIAEKNQYLESAADSIYSCVTDPKVLAMCRKRDEEIRGEKARIKKIKKLEKQHKKDVQQKEYYIQRADRYREMLLKNGIDPDD